MKSAGIRFTRDEYYGLVVEEESIKLLVNKDGEVTEYDVGGEVPSGSSTLDLRNFPHTMHAEEDYQIEFTVSDGATMEFSSNASASKISVSETGLMHCIGTSTGACVITITTKNSAGNVINEVKMRPTVA